MESILTSIKKLLGITEEYTHFDMDLIIHINAALSTLTQIGVGSPNGFSIKDNTAIWTDFAPEDPKTESLKTYVYMRVKMVFDPPQSSAVLEAYNRSISELEWRLQVTADS